MTKPYYAVLGLFLLGCSGSQNQTSTLTEYTEKGELYSTITHGIPAYDSTSFLYKKGGKDQFKISMSEPVVVSVAEKEEKWGFFQFPNIYKSVDGDIVASWQMASDHAESYGKENVNPSAISKDGGKTWTMHTGSKPLGGGLELPNGDRIENYTPAAIDTSKLKLPKKLATKAEAYGRTFSFYKMDELPDQLQGVYINRLKKGETEWKREHNKLIDPQAVRYTDDKLFPLVWWGDMKVESNNDIVTGTYPGFSLQNGEVAACGVDFYRSSDEGKSWKIVGRIPYTPDLTNDPNGDKRLALGFTEPAFDILADGSYLCVMRTADGLGNSPMYLSRSTDQGVTWSSPKVFTASGVLPKLAQLENGVTALAAGRPGMQLRFSYGTGGQEWTDAFEMMPFGSDQKDAVSCGYPRLLATGPDKFLLIYSDFKFKNDKGEIRKAIKVREITVTPL